MTLRKITVCIECHYTECRDSFIAVLNVVLLSFVYVDCQYAQCHGAIYRPLASEAITLCLCKNHKQKRHSQPIDLASKGVLSLP